MKNLVGCILFGAFLIALAYVCGIRLYDWYETGQLAMHRTMIYGHESVSYDSDPVLFVWEFGGNLFFIAISFLGLGTIFKELSA